MIRQRIDEYLDGSLNPAATREFEALLAQDAAAATLLKRMQTERALRAAAYDSYLPTSQESADLAAKMLDEAHYSPLAHIGYWVRRGAAVAAACAVVVGSFMAGQMTTSTKIVEKVVPTETKVYNVVYMDARGTTTESEDLMSVEERNAYINKVEGKTGLAAGDLNPLGHM